jgi:hypothetical protein
MINNDGIEIDQNKIEYDDNLNNDLMQMTIN